MTTRTSHDLAGVFLALCMLPAVIIGGSSTPAHADTIQPTSSTARHHVTVWQARKRHALHLHRAARARYVRHLATTMRPCPAEDSRNCVWNGNTAGNGVGRSFIDLAGTTFYFNGQVHRYV